MQHETSKFCEYFKPSLIYLLNPINNIWAIKTDQISFNVYRLNYLTFMTHPVFAECVIKFFWILTKNDILAKACFNLFYFWNFLLYPIFCISLSCALRICRTDIKCLILFKNCKSKILTAGDHRWHFEIHAKL